MTRENIIREALAKVEQAYELPTGWIELRNRQYADIRSIFYFIMNKERQFTLAEIARAMDKTHATIINGLRNYDSLKTFPEYREIERTVRAALDQYKVDTYDELLERIKDLESKVEELNASNGSASS